MHYKKRADETTYRPRSVSSLLMRFNAISILSLSKVFRGVVGSGGVFFFAVVSQARFTGRAEFEGSGGSAWKAKEED